jgi:alcohol dehydrogenase (cytochrome c)
MKTTPPLLLLALALVAGATARADVSYERIRDAAKEPGNWLTYSGNYAGHRHSPLAQIDPGNVASLKPAWVYQSREAGKWECTPIVVDGVLYITERPNIVTALDGRTGRPIWNYRRPMPTDVPGCCGPVNRGLAILGDALFLNTFDNHVVCLDASTGKERWDVVVADYKLGYSMTAAPLAVKDKIIVGISGGKFGIRGFLDAYDPATGKLLWRRHTIPAPGEPQHDTWGPGGETWKKGGGATWVTGTYDPALNTLYWGTGNPAPDYNDDARPGDNLYTNSVLALNPDTGEIRWHFQYTPHDTHDWDSNQVPVLIDTEIAGTPRQLLVQANRNAFFYVLDRTNGQFLAGQAFGKQTWAKGLDAKGRPIELPNTRPTVEGVLVYPGLEGIVNWPSPSYSPQTKLFYVQAKEDQGQTFYKLKPNEEPGENYEGGGTRNVLGAEPYGAIKAIEPTTGKVVWEFRETTSSNCGVLTTATGVLFSGTREGQFYALDAKSGAPLWRFTTGGQIHGGPVSFLVDGKQHVAVAAGQGLFVFAR